MSWSRLFLRAAIACASLSICSQAIAADLREDFVTPPDAAKPWVYWYFMDGNMTREGLTADLEAMHAAGIGGGIFLEVNVGIARGPVSFMSDEWQGLLRHAVSEADRVGIQIALGSGPGWCGDGGPWIKPEQSMQHLVATDTNVTGPKQLDMKLPQPQPRTPYFGEETLTPELKREWKDFYRDVRVIAFPTPVGEQRLADVNEKALYFREPYSSKPGVRPFLTSRADYVRSPAAECVASNSIIDISDKLDANGRLVWDVPAGNWTIMRLGRTITGQTTRPAPAPGLGFESDKFDTASLDAHVEKFLAPLLKQLIPLSHPGRGLTMLHFDSWEMSSQNWSATFRDEFTKRRGYDPLRYLPAMLGRIVDSEEITERFLWDLRETAQQLVVEHHANGLRDLAHQNGLQFSLEPYDLNPCADLNLGAAADVPSCEFWSDGYGFKSEYSCFEAVSVAHTNGHPVVGAEAFTAEANEQWRQYPASMKAQADWALCTGINKFVIHRYQHQPTLDEQPGMTMGPYGVHWERTQTWWAMVPGFHQYLARCSELLRRGLPVADVLYLTPEGAPHVFRPPTSALKGHLPDRRGYNFDGCDPNALIERATVKDGRVIFPDGMSYRLLVLPQFDTMTPQLLRKIEQLLNDGATVLGAPPKKSPGLEGYPACDAEVAALAKKLWTESATGERAVGEGRLIDDRAAAKTIASLATAPITSQPAAATFPDLYADYDTTAAILSRAGIRPDFESEAAIRYTHRRDGDADLYFIANTTDKAIDAACRFRVSGRQPEWWNPLTGETRDLPDFSSADGITKVPMKLGPGESGFVVFQKPAAAHERLANFASAMPLLSIDGPWQVSFDPSWGGPANVEFAKLDDWSRRPEAALRNYSGTAVYHKSFAFPESAKANGTRVYLSIGDVKAAAAVKLNGKDLGIVWCPPWRVEVPDALLRDADNRLEITVANLWINRLIGDAALPPAERLAKTTWNPFKPDDALQPSGLLGPVQLLREDH